MEESLRLAAPVPVVLRRTVRDTALLWATTSRRASW